MGTLVQWVLATMDCRVAMKVTNQQVTAWLEQVLVHAQRFKVPTPDRMAPVDTEIGSGALAVLGLSIRSFVRLQAKSPEIAFAITNLASLLVEIKSSVRKMHAAACLRANALT